MAHQPLPQVLDASRSCTVVSALLPGAHFCEMCSQDCILTSYSRESKVFSGYIGSPQKDYLAQHVLYRLVDHYDLVGGLEHF